MRSRIGLMREERLQIMLSPEELKAVDNLDLAIACRAGPQPFVNYFGTDLRLWEQRVENTGVKSGDYGVLKAPKGLGSKPNS